MLIDGTPAQATDLAHDRGLAYGDGVFETIALRHGRLLCADAHFARLRHGCHVLGFPPPTHETMARECALVSRDHLHGVIKIIVTRGAGGRGYRPPAVPRPRRLVALHPWPGELDGADEAPVKVWICRHPLSSNAATAGLKHLNRLDQVLAGREWPGSDFFEGLMLDAAGRLVEGTRSNLFLVRRGVVHTPALGHCGVNGIIRDAVMTACRGQGIPLVVGALPVTALTTADEVFICNSVMGIRAVSYIEGRNGIALAAGPVSRRIRRVLQRMGSIP